MSAPSVAATAAASALRRKVQVAIIGGGSAGINALREVSQVTSNYVVIDGGILGTTCARVGCMPSKVLIQVAEDLHRGRQHALMSAQGIDGGDALTISVPRALAHVRALRDGFTGHTRDAFLSRVGDRLVRAQCRFVEPNVVRLLDGSDSEISADVFVLATGSRPVVPKPWQENFGDLILTTDSLFEEEDLPHRLGVLGLGVIGLEMGQALTRLGLRVSAVDMLETIGGIRDPVVNRTAVETLREEFHDFVLGKPAELHPGSGGSHTLRMTAGDLLDVEVDKVLVCLGRRPNTDSLDLKAAGVPLNERGAPEFDVHTMQIKGAKHLFIAGDSAGDRALLHEAADEGRIAGYNAALASLRKPIVSFPRKTPLGITFCDPNIVSVGESLDALAKQGEEVEIGERRFDTQARAKVMGKAKGVLRVYGRKRDGKVLGASMCAPKGENLAHLLAWAISQDMTVWDLLPLPFYHPVIEEGLQNALTDLSKKVGGRPSRAIADLGAESRL